MGPPHRPFLIYIYIYVLCLDWERLLVTVCFCRFKDTRFVSQNQYSSGKFCDFVLWSTVRNSTKAPSAAPKVYWMRFTTIHWPFTLIGLVVPVANRFFEHDVWYVVDVVDVVRRLAPSASLVRAQERMKQLSTQFCFALEPAKISSVHVCYQILSASLFCPLFCWPGDRSTGRVHVPYLTTKNLALQQSIPMTCDMSQPSLKPQILLETYNIYIIDIGNPAKKTRLSLASAIKDTILGPCRVKGTQVTIPSAMCSTRSLTHQPRMMKATGRWPGWPGWTGWRRVVITQPSQPSQTPFTIGSIGLPRDKGCSPEQVTQLLPNDFPGSCKL